MVLTGRAATEALQLYVRLGATRSRFDARKVAASIRSQAGRVRLAFAIRRRSGSTRAPQTTARRSCKRVCRVATAASGNSPGRPRPIRVGGPDGPPFENGWGNA